MMTLSLALEITGGLSKPSKMPCFSWNIPAQRCKVGSKLRKVPNSICSTCYALKGRYVFPVVRNALERRYATMNHPQWVEAMIFLVTRWEKSGFFRWFDSGDLQGVEHLERIVEVVRGTPNVCHWLPTREYGAVATYLKRHGAFPDNLTVRLSAPMLEGKPLPLGFILGLPTSSVSAKGYNCPASKQQGKCWNCRLCWDKTEHHVVYKKH